MSELQTCSTCRHAKKRTGQVTCQSPTYMRWTPAGKSTFWRSRPTPCPLWEAADNRQQDNQ